jgi:hypothetical protein
MALSLASHSRTNGLLKFGRASTGVEHNAFLIDSKAAS